jgi:hypothetical protein
MRPVRTWREALPGSILVKHYNPVNWTKRASFRQTRVFGYSGG